MAILLENATVVTMDRTQPVLKGQQLIVDQGVIASMGRTIDRQGFDVEKRIDCSGKIVMPGLVNAHSHLLEVLQRGFRDNVRMEVWREYRMKTEERAHLSTAAIGAAARLACAEMLKSGVTAVVDHFSPRWGASIEQMRAVVDGFERTGIRGVLAVSLRDQDFIQLVRSESRGNRRSGNGNRRPWRENVLNLLEHARESTWPWAVMLGPANPLNCSDALLGEVVEMAEEYDLGIHTHLLETRLQPWGARKLHRKGVVERADRLGLLSPRLSAAHGVWLSEREMDLMAARGASVVHNPASNLKLGSGIAPVAKLKEHGVNIALGTDGGDTSDAYSIFDQMKLAALLSRVMMDDPNLWVTAPDALRMATLNGAQAVPAWRGRIGKIRKGYAADLVILKPHIRLRPLNDVVNQLVFSEGGHSVDTVIVNGAIAVLEGKLTRVHEGELIEGVERISKRMYKLYRLVLKESRKTASAIGKLYAAAG